MPRSPLDAVHCSIARTVDLVGEWWTPLVLRDLFSGMTRFEDLRRDLGIASNVLTNRLDRLVEHGIVERQQYQEAPARHEYVLTEKGRDLFPVVLALMRWGDRWVAGDDGPPALIIHDVCGTTTTGTVVCTGCGEPLDLQGVHGAPGPGGRIAPGTVVVGEFLVRSAADGPLRRSRAAEGPTPSRGS